MTAPTPLTDEKIGTIARQSHEGVSPHDDTLRFAYAIESEVNARWKKMLGERDAVAEVVVEPDYWSGGHFYGGSKPYINNDVIRNLPIGTKLYTHPAPDHTALLRQALDVLIEHGAHIGEGSETVAAITEALK